MRLEKIKLAGFKSFVEPTAVGFPARLIGIVGPNGCGKSNLIDAVRFVIGESSARHLRGSAMSDVIFNGSSRRKPAELASVELIFDNREGRLGGEYAGFLQISLKRQVTRDGQSQYFLNGTRCRRRDVQDVLLGTGLGPRSYAIIEQGMISHLIEAKPEELRLFVEEAAGLSKYKERRHETELKLAHVRANLDRVSDIRSELEKQVGHLAKQAKKAEQYRKLTQSIRQCQGELIAIQWRAAEREHRRQQARLSELEKALAAKQEALARAEQKVAAARAETQALTQRLHSEQARLYELNAAVSQCDQSLRHARRTLEERERSLDAWRAELKRSQDAIAEIQAQLTSLKQEREHLAQELERCRIQAEEAKSRRHTAETRWQEVKQECDRQYETLKQHESGIELLKTEIRHLERHLAQTRARYEQLTQERRQLEQALNELDIDTLTRQLVELQAVRAQQLEAIETIGQTIRQLDGQKLNTEQRLKELEGEHSRLQGKISALETLQRHALGKDRSRLNEWLKTHGFQDAPRLAEVLEAEAGWETAVEVALAEWLGAICVGDFTFLTDAASGLEDDAAFILHPIVNELAADDPCTLQANEAGKISAGDSLTGKVRSALNLTALLGGFRCIETLSEALVRRGELAKHECWITPFGDQLGPERVKLSRRRESDQGILDRQKSLRELHRQLETLEQGRQQERNRLSQLTSALAEAERRLKTLQAEERDSHTRLIGLKAELNTAKLRRAEIHQRLKQVTQAHRETSQQCQTQKDSLAGYVQELANKIEIAAAQAEALKKLQGECDLARADLDRLEAETRCYLDRKTRLEAALEHNRHASQLMQQQLQRAESQVQQLKARLKHAEAEQTAGKAPIERAQRELETLFSRRTSLENDLACTRAALKRAEAELHAQTGLWHRLEETRDQARGALEQARLAAEAARVRWQTAAAQVEAEAVDLPKILESLPEVADAQVWQKQLDQLKAQQASLGDVNLVAIEEHRVHLERLHLLDKQYADLETSLKMLAKAIRQIDRESQACFRTTFETVDRHFRERFSVLFGGGEAWMELTGSDNPLDAGVRIVARPPGKRNHSIHLLSGGEKALTAVALVFSFFELNPAPVCLLDEVDAPLDEANVERFCQLLKSMSERVQFIFITHNKTTMEIAAQLIGVTMREPGVSRIVAVDLKQAAEMAAA